MLFNSWEFLFFFPITTILFFITPHKGRWLILLAASSVFYCYFIPVYLLILFFTIAVDYTAGIFIETSTKNKKVWLIASIAANLGVLAIFKYYNFFTGNLNAVTKSHLPFLNIILPIGLSFHTFQAMSYTIEVYYRRYKAERHLGLYALYVMFYPQLVAGPIERPQHMFPQFKTRQYFNWDNLLNGIRLMLWGFFKKVVIADRIADFVSAVFNHPGQQHFIIVWAGIFLFAIQIYCDFSGYSDIAIGCAKVMGYDLMINFNRPYFARSIGEFWKRWHISLSTWFRDYLYKPLGGNRKGYVNTYVNLLIVFALSGLWHGAGWTFIVWGLIHGMARVTEIILERFTAIPKHTIINYFISMLIVLFAWIFFRASSIENAVNVIKQALSFKTNVALYPAGLNDNAVPYSRITIMYIILTIGGMFAIEKYTDPKMFVLNKSKSKDIIFCVMILTAILLTGVFNKTVFIYFQF
ncbi:MAG: MBOAT family protein [Bacteroidota bacterium]|nr:MBOAT family protein [Bacteroidota bacterium]